MSQDSPTRILILGGGFGGMYAALELEKRLRPVDGAELILVNRENFFLFTPMLHEVAASDLDVTHIVNPIRKLLRRARLITGEVAAIDLSERRITVLHGFGEHEHEHQLEYDYLILSLGSVTNFYGLPGLETRALTMRTLADAISLRNRLIAILEQADSDCGTRADRGLLTFAVAGGGFAGVETIAAVNDFLREAIRHYPRVSEEALRLVLVHPGPAILPELGDHLGAYSQRKLTERGVEIHVNTKVTGFSGEAVELSDGSAIPCQTLLWTAGTAPDPLIEELPTPRERGRLCVNAFLEVPDWPGVWALGDCAAVPDSASGHACPPTAQHALRQGQVVARNVVAAIRGGEKRAFDFRGLGQLAAIGRRTGVARIFGINFSGFVAWWLWRTVYLAKLPRVEKKLRVALDWTLDLIFSKDLVQFQSFRHPRGTGLEDPRVRTETR